MRFKSRWHVHFQGNFDVFLVLVTGRSKLGPRLMIQSANIFIFFFNRNFIKLINKIEIYERINSENGCKLISAKAQLFEIQNLTMHLIYRFLNHFFFLVCVIRCSKLYYAHVNRKKIQMQFIF